MDPLDVLQQRMNDHFSGPYMKLDQEFNVETIVKGSVVAQQRGKIVIVANVKENYGHAAVLLPTLGEEWKGLPEHVKETVTKLRREVKIEWQGLHDDSADGLDTIDYTKSIFIFTHKLAVPRSEIKNGFRLRGYKVEIFDDDRWNAEWGTRYPDAFISYDFRNETEIAEPLYKELGRRLVKVWFAKVTLTMGDGLAGTIDKGLTKARHGILIVTPEYLENTGWASTEMNTLLSRHGGAGRSRIILPVWHGVTDREVRARSAMLADILARQTSIGFDKLADEIARIIVEEKAGGRKG